MGDVILCRGVGKRIRLHGSAWPLAEAAPTLRPADLAIANLEGPLTRQPAVRGGIALPSPPEYARALRDGGLTVATLANNHTLDCGPGGLSGTLRTLHALGIAAAGAGAGQREAAQPAIVEAHGLRIAVLAFLADMPGLRRPPATGPTVALATPGTIAKTVAAARKRADIVIVALHAGQEQSPRPDVLQERLALEAASAGADLVIGHHPHRLQGLRVVRGAGGRRTLIAYSLGNFLFDTPIEGDRATVILLCTFGKSGLASARVVPYRIQDCHPAKPTTAQRRAILDRLSELSREKGTKVLEGRVDLGERVPR